MTTSAILSSIDRKNALSLLDSPNDSRSWDMTGQELIREQKLATALRCFRWSEMSGPSFSEDVVYRLAMAFELSGDLEAAADRYLTVCRNGSVRFRDARRRALGCLSRMSEWGRMVDLMSGEDPRDWAEFPDVCIVMALAHGSVGSLATAIGWICLNQDARVAESEAGTILANLTARGSFARSPDEIESLIRITAPILFSSDWLARKVLKWLVKSPHNEVLGDILLAPGTISESSGECLQYAAIYFAERGSGAARRRAAQLALVWEPSGVFGFGAILPGESELPEANSDMVRRWSKAAIVVPHKEAPIVNNAVIALKHLDEESGIAYLERAAACFRASPKLLYNVGSYLNEKSFAEAAAPMLERAILLDPAYSKALSAYSVSRSIMLDPWPAVTAAKRATCSNPRILSGFTNLAMAYRGTGDLAKAIEAGNRQLKLDPKDVTARMGVAFNQLAIGAIEAGFENYRSRWGQKDFPSAKRPFPQREWALQKVPKGKKALVYMEQGMGDEFMFSWFLQYADRCAPGQIVVECDRRLVEIFKRSLPSIEFCPRAVSPPEARLLEDDILYKVPAGHLPSLFSADLRSLIRERWALALENPVGGYGWIKPDSEGVARWRQRLSELGSGDRIFVGVAWRSMNLSRTRKLQYLEPEELAASLPSDSVVINLQYVYEDEEIDRFNAAGAGRGLSLTTLEGLDLKDDLSDVIDLMAALDAVVTPMTSTAFMGGVLGVPTWIFRSAESRRAWQQLGTPHIPWIPSMMLRFRNPRDSWDSVVSRIKEEIGSSREWMISRRLQL